ncbi:MAG: glycosyltransferase [Alistipes sp.]
MQICLTIIDWIFFIFLGGSVYYLFVYALFSMRRQPNPFPKSPVNHRFVILIPAYKGDEIIRPTITAALQQNYPIDRFRVVVIADHFRPETLAVLAQEPITLLTVQFEQSSKAKALNYAMAQLGDDAADVVAILDVDNIVQSDFLQQLNNAYESGVIAMQAHRKALNRDTDTAVLDAVSEEINNAIFRRGHIALGLSSALIGSGMAFDYSWFRRNVTALSSAGEDKELERLLLKQKIFIDYLEEVEVLDEKTRSESNFYQQRRRWLAAQFYSLFTSLRDLPKALIAGNVDYCDKLIQWMIPPRILLLGVIPLWALLLLFFDPAASAKWWITFLVLLFALAFATPNYLVDDRFKHALRRIPVHFLQMFATLFRLRGASKTFIHTTHGDKQPNE